MVCLNLYYHTYTTPVGAHLIYGDLRCLEESEVGSEAVADAPGEAAGSQSLQRVDVLAEGGHRHHGHQGGLVGREDDDAVEPPPAQERLRGGEGR